MLIKWVGLMDGAPEDNGCGESALFSIAIYYDNRTSLENGEQILECPFSMATYQYIII